MGSLEGIWGGLLLLLDWLGSFIVVIVFFIYLVLVVYYSNNIRIIIIINSEPIILLLLLLRHPQLLSQKLNLIIRPLQLLLQPLNHLLLLLNNLQLRVLINNRHVTNMRSLTRIIQRAHILIQKIVQWCQTRHHQTITITP